MNIGRKFYHNDTKFTIIGKCAKVFDEQLLICVDENLNELRIYPSQINGQLL